MSEGARATPVRILLSKPTQDCHDRGVRYLARTLRDRGFEVIFTNFLLANELVTAAVQEDVDVIGISSSSGGHMPVFEDLMLALRAAAVDPLVVGGGVIPASDAVRLKQMGVAAVFGPGSSADEFVDFIEGSVR
jgi:methylmalonyl-CoA mutase, C-terminal domain